MADLTYKYGAMSSGKSTALLQLAHNYKQKDMVAYVIKPSVDTKGNDTIVSRLGIQRKVDLLLTPEDTIYRHIENQGFNAILVDEAQFLTAKQVEELYAIAKVHDVPVICYGLRCDFSMAGFPGSTRLLEIADNIEEMRALCQCGDKATQNLRKINGEEVFAGKQVVIDNSATVEYESVCGKCYLKKRNKRS